MFECGSVLSPSNGGKWTDESDFGSGVDEGGGSFRKGRPEWKSYRGGRVTTVEVTEFGDTRKLSVVD